MSQEEIHEQKVYMGHGNRQFGDATEASIDRDVHKNMYPKVRYCGTDCYEEEWKTPKFACLIPVEPALKVYCWYILAGTALTIVLILTNLW